VETDWVNQVQATEKLWALMNMVMSLQGSIKWRECVEYLRNYYTLRKDSGTLVSLD
jgi:hypothetical protein